MDGGWGWWYILQRRACGRDPPVACELVVSACGRDPPGGGDFLKKDLVGDTLDTPITPELL